MLPTKVDAPDHLISRHANANVHGREGDDILCAIMSAKREVHSMAATLRPCGTHG